MPGRTEIIRKLSAKLDTYLLLLGSVFIFYWFRAYLSSGHVPSVDLPGHIALVERLTQALKGGQLFFYDPNWFSGWPAFQFYGFAFHLVAAILSIALAFFTNGAVKLAVYFLLCLGLALLPFSVYYAARPIVNRDSRGSALLALWCFVLSFWYLNHDHQWFGIGAASILNIGLFSQLLGWHLLLLYIGMLFRYTIQRTKKLEFSICITFSLLILAHPLTTIFAALFLGFILVLDYENRFKLLKAHFLSLLLCSFWLVPFFAFSEKFTGLDIEQPKGDFFQLLFRYPLITLFDYLRAVFSGDQVGAINLINILVLLIPLFGIFQVKTKQNHLVLPLFIFLLFAALFFQSEYIASSLPLGIHYYRFQAYLFLLTLVLLGAWPFVLLKVEDLSSLWKGVLAVSFLGLIINTVSLPHHERTKIAKYSNNQTLSDEFSVLNHLKENGPKGRVLFEYFDNYNLFTFLSAHEMSSRLKKETDRESLNGLFLQSSLANRFPVSSASQLQIRNYSMPNIFSHSGKISNRARLEQLKDFGVSHIVLGHSKALKNLNITEDSVEIFGRYKVIEISNTEPELIKPVNRSVVGFYDVDGHIPFRFMEFYFYSREALWRNLVLLQLDSLDDLPEIVDVVLVNGASGNLSKPVVELNYSPKSYLDHYNVRYQHNFELDEYNSLVDYLDRERLEPKFSTFFSAVSQKPAAASPKLSWSKDYSQLSLANLIPGTLYSINYSYFPFWSSSDGSIFRGFPERIFFLAEKTAAVLNYSYFSNWWSRLGLVLSLVGLGFLLGRWRKL